jgi:hypothetical protein
MLVGLGILLAGVYLPAASPPGAASLGRSGRLVVHEWGTFLSVQGSDGATLGGMVDSDEPLPPFVESRGIQAWQRSLMCQKMETPVTYFYTDNPRDVDVRIDMPKGVLTHWYPMVHWFWPAKRTLQFLGKGNSDYQSRLGTADLAFCPRDRRGSPRREGVQFPGATGIPVRKVSLLPRPGHV